MITTLIIALATYIGMVCFTRYRTPIATLGSGILLTYGTLTNPFSANLAFQRFPTEIIILIVVLALFTKFFENAGFFEYIGNRFLPIVGHKLVYAALALGILAGSSMLPWSATGGPVMLSEVSRFLNERVVKPKDKENILKILNLKNYLAFSIPFSLIILLLSGIFLSFYIYLFSR